MGTLKINNIFYELISKKIDYIIYSQYDLLLNG